MSLLAALLLALNALFLAAPAAAGGHHPAPGPGGVEVDGNTPNADYCAGFAGGYRADSAGDHTADQFSVVQNDDGTITVTAADGYVISLVLVKAGDNHYRYEVSTSGGTFQGPRADSVSNWVVCWDEAPDTPVEVTPDTPTFTDPTCESNDAGLTLPDGPDGVTYVVTGDQEPGGTVTVTAVATDGYTFPDGTTTVWNHTYGPAATNCEPPVEVTPDTPTFTDPTCESNDAGLALPDGPDGVTYVVTGDQEPGGTVTVTAVATDGYTFPDGTTTVWNHTYGPAATDCETPEEPTEPGEPTEPEEPTEPTEPEEPTTGVAPDVVVRPAVTFADPDCTDPDGAEVTVTEVDGIEYAITGDVEPGGIVTVTASATEGHRIARGVQTTWTHEFADLDCDVVEVLPNVVTRPQPAPAAPLAATGMDATEMLLLALLLMGLGGVALLEPQSRREH